MVCEFYSNKAIIEKRIQKLWEKSTLYLEKTAKSTLNLLPKLYLSYGMLTYILYVLFIIVEPTFIIMLSPDF